MALGGAVAASLGVAVAVTSASWWWPQVPPSVTQTVQLTSDRHAKGFGSLRMAHGSIFLRGRKTVGSLLRCQVMGGEPVPISAPFRNAVVQDISPKGRELLVTASEQELRQGETTRSGPFPLRAGSLTVWVIWRSLKRGGRLTDKGSFSSEGRTCMLLRVTGQDLGSSCPCPARRISELVSRR